MAKRSDGLARARSVLLTILSVEVAVLVVTGVALFFVYVPTADQSWSDLVTGSYDRGARLADGIRLVHLLASWLAFPTAIATGVVVALRGRADIRRWNGIALGVGTPVALAVASFTGFLLPWDQLALWTVTVGSNIRGYRVIFGPHVRFVLAGGAELAPSTFIRWLLIHMAVLGPAVVALVVLGWRRHRAASSG